ncbi:MAG TPA: DMT family transporter [Anaerolineales bacterium]|jgi:drug/metabolite transporter (DMT)-like permease
MDNQPKAVIYLEALFAVAVWGCTFIATKIALREISPASIVWLRFGIGVLILGVTVALRKQMALPKRNEWAYLALTGFLGVTFHQWLQATGLITAQATVTAWIVATIPIFTAILGWLFLKEKLGPIRILGIVVASLGVLLVVSKGDLGALTAGKFGTQGDFLILMSAVNWAIFSILSRRGLATHPPARMMFYVMLFGWIFAWMWVFGAGPGLSEIPRLSGAGWASVLFLAIFGSGLAYIAWYDALKVLPASQLGVFIYIEPLVTMVVAAVLLAEAVTPAAVTGGAITILGIYLVNRQ